MKLDDVLLIGPGAIGVYFAGRLAQAGAEVTVAARSDYGTVAAAGYEVESVAGDFGWKPPVVRSAAEFGRPARLIVVAVKALPGVDLAELVRPAVGPQTAFLLIQNGLDVEKPLAEAFPGNELLSAIAFIGVSRTAPGKVTHAGGGKLTVGRYPKGGDSPLLKTLCTAFESVGVGCAVAGDTDLMRYRKLLWNAPFNPLSVLTGGMDTRELVNDAKVVELAMAIMKEVQATAAAEGRALTDAELQWNIDYTRDFPAYKTSMLLDFESGRPLEVEAILGALARRARKSGVATPHIDAVYALLAAADAKNREK